MIVRPWRKGWDSVSPVVSDRFSVPASSSFDAGVSRRLPPAVVSNTLRIPFLTTGVRPPLRDDRTPVAEGVGFRLTRRQRPLRGSRFLLLRRRGFSTTTTGSRLEYPSNPF